MVFQLCTSQAGFSKVLVMGLMKCVRLIQQNRNCFLSGHPTQWHSAPCSCTTDMQCPQPPSAPSSDTTHFITNALCNPGAVYFWNLIRNQTKQGLHKGIYIGYEEHLLFETGQLSIMSYNVMARGNDRPTCTYL